MTVTVIISGAAALVGALLGLGSLISPAWGASVVRLQPMAAAQVQAHLIRLVALGNAVAVADGWLCVQEADPLFY